MSIKTKLYWEKYRPQSEKNLILLPRIQNIIKNGIVMNMIFHGTSGTGKSTLANILAEKHSFIKINASMENGIVLLRETIDNYINQLDFSSKDNFKVIYLDEFDEASSALQNALKGYIEKYEDRVRFIFTTNHINKINNELRSRFSEISFDSIDTTERKFLHEKYSLYLRAIAKNEKSDIYTKHDIINRIIAKSFPDLRKSTVLLQEMIISGNTEICGGEYGDGVESVYSFIMDMNLDPITNYDYVMNNFITNFDDVFAALGRPFFEWMKQYHTDKLMLKGGSIIKTQGEYYKYQQSVPDPIIHLINFIISLKECLK